MATKIWRKHSARQKTQHNTTHNTMIFRIQNIYGQDLNDFHSVFFSCHCCKRCFFIRLSFWAYQNSTFYFSSSVAFIQAPPPTFLSCVWRFKLFFWAHKFLCLYSSRLIVVGSSVFCCRAYTLPLLVICSYCAVTQNSELKNIKTCFIFSYTHSDIVYMADEKWVKEVKERETQKSERRESEWIKLYTRIIMFSVFRSMCVCVQAKQCKCDFENSLNSIGCEYITISALSKVVVVLVFLFRLLAGLCCSIFNSFI